MSNYPVGTTYCSLCGNGTQDVQRKGQEGSVAIYSSSCWECGDGFPIRIEAGTPEQELQRLKEQNLRHHFFIEEVSR